MATDLRAAEFRRILLIKPTALGDVVHTLPVLVKLRRRFPQAQIDWLVTPENAELVRDHPALSRVVLFDRAAFRKNPWLALRGLGFLLRGLRQARYDLVIDLHGQLRSGLFAAATGAPVRIGYDRPARQGHGWAGAREFSWLAYTHRMPIRTLEVHAIDRYLWLGELLGFDAEPPALALHLPPPSPRLEQAPLAVIAPGTMWETKHWRIEAFAEIARRLAAAGYAVTLVGTGREAPLCAQVKAACPAAIDLSGKTSPAELGSLLGSAALCVSNDSGAMHLAVAMGTPVVAVFGPTNPVTVGPYGERARVVRAGLPCSPCYLRRLSQCPFGHECMHAVSVDDVWQAIESLQLGAPGKTLPLGALAGKDAPGGHPRGASQTIPPAP